MTTSPPASAVSPSSAAVAGRGGVRIGDAERERAVSEIGEHFAAGRLTRDELDERLELAWRARTAADLAPLFADLPRGTVEVRGGDRAPVPARRGQRSGPPFGFRPLLLLLVPIAIVLTILTHVPFVAFFIWWFVIGGFFRGGFGRRPYAWRS